MVTFFCRLRSFLFSLFRSFVHSSQPAVIQVLQCRNKSVYLFFPRFRPEDFEIPFQMAALGTRNISHGQELNGAQKLKSSDTLGDQRSTWQATNP
jgi:hypothetical protein